MVKVAIDVDAAAVLQELARLWRQTFGQDLRLSLVCPQPVALQRLNTGTRMNSRMDGSPRMRTSPHWPLEENT